MKIKQVFHVFLFRSIYAFTYAISLLPIKLLYAMSSFTFIIVYYVAGYRKEVVIQNIARSFPDKRYGEIQAISKKFYSCFTAYFAEIIKAVSAPAEIIDQKITFENLELIDRYINSGKNVIACMGHCANWEMLNFMAYKTQHEIYAVYKPLRSETIDRLMIRIRSRFGMKLIKDKSVVRHIISMKKSPSVYLFLTDQCPRINEEKYKFKLLNQETYIFSGMEKLARISKSAVIYLHIRQKSKGYYQIICMPVCPHAESVNEGEITKKYINLLAENIKEKPYGWLWTHKRWKR